MPIAWTYNQIRTVALAALRVVLFISAIACPYIQYLQFRVDFCLLLGRFKSF